MSWNFAQIWNDVLERPDNRIVEPRERIWASEIGGSMIDRYLKMKGTQYTNPPNSRSMRKFMAGDIWEWIVQTVLLKAGLMIATQEKIWYDPSDGLLPVSGRLDFVAGGNPDWEKSKEEFSTAFYPEFIQRLGLGMIEVLQDKYPMGLEGKILEIKSCSSFMFEKYLTTNKPNIHHAMQAYLYTQGTEYDQADVVYVCRDDVRILEFPVMRSDIQYEDYLKSDRAEITYFINNNVQPEKEKLILWDADLKKFTKNWKVEYSPYLSMLYENPNKPGINFERPDEYAEYVEPKVSAWNRVVTRYKKGSALTKSNNDYIEEMLAYGFDLTGFCEYGESKDLVEEDESVAL